MKTKVIEILKNKGEQVVTIASGSTVLDAVRQMNDNKMGSVVVIDKKEKIIGILTERDVLCSIADKQGNIENTKVDDIMSKNIIIGVPNDEVGYLMGIMTQNRIRHLPIMDNEKLAGIISIGDLVKSRLEEAEFENRMLSEYMQSG
jgi:CBS domain-containing protein